MTTTTRATPSTPDRSDHPDRNDRPPRPDCGCGCRIDVHAARDVHVHQYCEPTGGPGTPPPAPCDCPPQPEANGCLPPVAGTKHKQSPAQRTARRLAASRVPSVLAASTLALVRRFLAGDAPANPLEQAAFARLARATPGERDTLRCAVGRIDALPASQRRRLFDPRFEGRAPVEPSVLSAAFGREIAQRASDAAFGEPLAFEEPRPGLQRVYVPPPEDFFTQVRICTILGLRTDDFIPSPAPGDWRPDEVAQDCTTTLVDGRPQVTCTVRTGDCNGPAVPGLCLRIPEVKAGDAVLLQGVNFFSVDAQVALMPKAGGAPRTVAAHVFGDVDTPVHETVDGQQRLVNDCRVKDRLSFRVPEDLAAGDYELEVRVPNVTGIPQFGEQLVSNRETLRVTVPDTARFEIFAEELICRDETTPRSFGSDEVGLRFLAMPLLADLSTGSLQTTSRRFGDVDSGDTRRIDRTVFRSEAPILGVALSLLGHEVDGEDAYENLVTSTSDLFVDLVKEQAEFIKGALAAAGISLTKLTALGTTGAIVIGIAIAVVLIVDLIVAYWAPADLLIEDPTGYGLQDLVERTSASFPAPATGAFTTEQGIRVTVTPQEKVPLQYRERRDYHAPDEESRYAVICRFNRTA